MPPEGLYDRSAAYRKKHVRIYPAAAGNGYSANLSRILKLLEAEDWSGLTDWLLEKVVALYNAGAEFAAIGSNSPHIVFEEVSSRSPIPMLSIVAKTSKYAKERGFSKLGLLGTRFTMASDFYEKSFESAEMEIVVPETADQELIHHRL